MDDAPNRLRSRRILIVDDEDNIREVVQTCLEALGGWQVSIAGSGWEALQKALTELPDAIVLDVMMPGMDGLKFLQLLRSHPQTAAIPVVLLTVRVEFTDPHLLSTLGVVGAIAKPFNPLLLSVQVAQALGWIESNPIS